MAFKASVLECLRVSRGLWSCQGHGTATRALVLKLGPGGFQQHRDTQTHVDI